MDVAPQFAAISLSVANSVAAISGALAPIVVGHILEAPHEDMPHWRTVFFLTSVITVVGWIFYAIFASGLRAKEFDATAGEEGTSPGQDGSGLHEAFKTLTPLRMRDTADSACARPSSTADGVWLGPSTLPGESRTPHGSDASAAAAQVAAGIVLQADESDPLLMADAAVAGGGHHPLASGSGVRARIV